MNLYKSLSKVKIAFLCCELIFLPLSLYLGVMHRICNQDCSCIHDKSSEILYWVSFILGPLILLTYIIVLIISLDIHIKYITNFINRINFDFLRIKNDLKWNIIILIYHFIFLIILFNFISYY